MALSTGKRLGPYEVLSPAGAGGMGEVYRARDTRLDRTVAIKVLPAHLAENPDLKQRFEREARAVSSLNHPNICLLFDIGHQDGIDFLVMEYLEGETLAARLEKGALPPDQMLRSAVQIADALDKAHRQGVIHRDLKPGNIMLTKSGVKLLDFGLAKALPTAGIGDFSQSPTQSRPLTAEGTIVGTFQYMAPEQLEGKEVDARTDIFTFGAVLYEMATGRKAFEGKSQASLIAAIVSSDPPPISTLQPMIPQIAGLDRVVRTCLAKDPDERWQTAHDVMLELKWIAEAGSQAGVPAPLVARRKSRERFAWVTAAILAALTVTLGVAYFRIASTETRAVRSYILPPEKSGFATIRPGAGPVVVSPDGRRIVFSAQAGGKYQLWVRALDSLTAQPLSGTENGIFPFWSADSRYIGFFAGGSLKKIDATGGPPISLCSVSQGRGGTWNREDVIIFAPHATGGLFRVSASGGAATPLTKPDTSKRESSHRWPSFLPDGRHFLYLVQGSTGEGRTYNIYVSSLDGKENTLVLRAGSNAVYASGHLLFVRESSLMAQPFDVKRQQVRGDAVPIAEQVQFDGTVVRGTFSASENGVLAYQSGGTLGGGSQFLWFTREGKQIGSVGEPAVQFSVRLSPDGQRLATEILDPKGANADIWIYELKRGLRTRLTFDPAVDRIPIWAPDGSRVVFASGRKGSFDLYGKAASGAGSDELLLESNLIKSPTDWSRDGRFITYTSAGDPKTKADIWVLPLFADRKPFVFLQTEFNESGGQFSPDGRWMAYTSDESGRDEVYVAPFPGPGGKWQVSTAGGTRSKWRRDGKELFYLAADNKLMAAEVKTKGTSFEVGNVRPLFETHAPPVGPVYDVSTDGRRFLVNTVASQQASSPITLVTNWTADLKK